jgi:hypothetical protein
VRTVGAASAANARGRSVHSSSLETDRHGSLLRPDRPDEIPAIIKNGGPQSEILKVGDELFIARRISRMRAPA